MNMNRRDALKLGGVTALGVAAAALPFGGPVSGSTPSTLSSKYLPRPFRSEFKRLEVLDPVARFEDADGWVERYDVTAMEGKATIVSGLSTPVLGYQGLVPAKRIDVEQGTRVEMTMRNRLPAVHPTFGTPLSISTHLHGSASLPQYDGYASDLTPHNYVKTYKYPNFQPARTLWYHDHGVHYTAQNAYSGLASQYHLHDPAERELLPQGEFDVALTLNDMIFTASGAQLYDDRSHSGLWGDVIVVNGSPWPVMKVKRRIYRFRILNASLSRSYRASLSPSTPMYVVATDGGLVPKTQAVTQFRQAPAERYEILIDFSKFAVGQRIEMRNLSNPNNRDYNDTNKIMAFDVVDDSFDKGDPTAFRLPTLLDPGNDVMALQPSSGLKVRNIRVKRDDVTNEWNLNDQTWRDVEASGFRSVLANPTLGDTEIWNIENGSGGWFHPLHIHLVDFKILSRNGKPPLSHELGPKDVVYVGEGESVKLIMKFGPHRGKYMVHCHNLPHEDHDMMHQFSVGLNDDYVDVNDPIEADKPIWDEES
ncbi:MAG TPA: multicopper oxidase domain-containing protein [Propionibacteriaceae bacterium]|nr:multicopper oxidase domain-containing protein [Propionibacteriaceae bacterium]